MRRSGIPTIESVEPPPPPEQSDPKLPRRMMLFLAAVIGFSLLIAAQFVRWQIIERASLMEGLAARGGYYEQVPSQRGLIVDRNHNLLALNNYDFSIEAAPNMIPDRQTREVAEKLAPVLGYTQEKLFNILDGNALYAQVARHVPREVGKAVIALGIKGIFVRPIAVRVYPEGELGAHILGFVAGDAEEGSMGYYGVEGFYDKALKGKAGVREEAWDPWTRPVAFADRRAYGWTLPEEGRTLVLTIDRTIQYLLEQELYAAIEQYGAESGCIVVMNPKTGALIAAVSYPTYDPGRFAETDEALFINPVIGQQYEPGSTFKIVTFAAALDTSTIQPTDLYNDLGYIEVGGRVIKNWDQRNYGMVSMTDVLIKSLNTGTAHINTLMGANTFYNYVGRFGFGLKTGIDMEGEIAGQVRWPGDAEWHESDLGTNAFGQGLAVTPIQLVAAVSAVANRGFLMQPYVVEQLVRQDRVASVKHVTVRQVINERTARTLTEMMVEVVEQGATQAQVPGYRIAGKSGTAQMPIVGGYDPNLTIASFIGFAPADNPQFVALVRLDKPTQSPWGSSTAAPTFANVARILFTQLGIPPDPAHLARGGQ